ncbi:hypothetical protein AQUCO_10400014v1 [Aquilegia coerulea]|uniref:Uncharacterized protein n=1 Tax=Aquilegia coerulea TaxID=218851 RepID=A0A2G5C3N5_AQUCA|nr:hypothetical protein AQUCO_10400014v1 [Aquilegia coerulea]
MFDIYIHILNPRKNLKNETCKSENLLPWLLHCCYGSNWQMQIGVVMGLGALSGKVTVEILCLALRPPLL